MEPQKNWPKLWQEWMAGWADGKNPVMPFWAKDWITDQQVRWMSVAEKGAYITLLANNWVDGSLPDPRELDGTLSRVRLDFVASLSGVQIKSRQWSDTFRRKLWPALESHFVRVSEGRISNKRAILEGVRIVRERERKRAQYRGENPRRKSGENEVSPEILHSLPSSSPSPSPSSIPPFPPEGGKGASRRRGTRKGNATTWRGREAARDERVSKLNTEKGKKVIAESEAAKAAAEPPPEGLLYDLRKLTGKIGKNVDDGT